MSRNRKHPPEGSEDNPEWTAEDFRKARPAGEVLPEAAVAALVKSKGGRPSGSSKEQVSLRIDRAALDYFRAGGPGWQSRINEVIRKAAGL
jgi:uncharacterized protein (DUF4415 family)